MLLVLFKFMLFLQLFQEVCSSFCDSDGVVSAKGLTQFLLTVQGERNVTEKRVARHMRDYLQDNQRNVPEPYFTANEVLRNIFMLEDLICCLTMTYCL